MNHLFSVQAPYRAVPAAAAAAAGRYCRLPGSRATYAFVSLAALITSWYTRRIFMLITPFLCTRWRWRCPSEDALLLPLLYLCDCVFPLSLVQCNRVGKGCFFAPKKKMRMMTMMIAVRSTPLMSMRIGYTTLHGARWGRSCIYWKMETHTMGAFGKVWLVCVVMSVHVR